MPLQWLCVRGGKGRQRTPAASSRSHGELRRGARPSAERSDQRHARCDVVSGSSRQKGERGGRVRRGGCSGTASPGHPARAQ